MESVDHYIKGHIQQTPILDIVPLARSRCAPNAA